MALVETFAFTLAGLAVGAAALSLLPGWFPAGRALTLATAVVSALLAGGITRFALDGDAPLASLAAAAIGSGLLVSVLARPDQAPRRRGSHRRHRHA